MSPRRTAVPVGPDEERQSVSYQVERGDEIVAARDPDMRDATADVGVQADRVAEDRAIGAGRALRVELGHGPALALVAFEQRLARPSPQDPAQLPADVKAVADRGVEPGGAARGDPVRGVADQERVAHPESLREPDAVAEHTRTLDLDRQVRSAGGVADQPSICSEVRASTSSTALSQRLPNAQRSGLPIGRKTRSSGSAMMK